MSPMFNGRSSGSQNGVTLLPQYQISGHILRGYFFTGLKNRLQIWQVPPTNRCPEMAIEYTGELSQGNSGNFPNANLQLPGSGCRSAGAGRLGFVMRILEHSAYGSSEKWSCFLDLKNEIGRILDHLRVPCWNPDRSHGLPMFFHQTPARKNTFEQGKCSPNAQSDVQYVQVCSQFQPFSSCILLTFSPQDTKPPTTTCTCTAFKALGC